LVSFAVVLFVVGVVLLGAGDAIIRAFILKQIPLDNPTKLVFKVWADTSYDGTSVKRKLYFYDVTNAHDVVDKHARPDLRRVGPYVYREHQWNPYEDIFYGPDGSVGFTYRDTLTFIPEESIDANGNQLSEADKVTTMNFPFFALIHRLTAFAGTSFIAPWVVASQVCPKIEAFLAASGAVGDTGIFVRRNISDLLWGYADPMFLELSATFGALGYDLPTRFHYFFNGSIPAPSPASAAQGQKCPVWDDQSVCNQSAVDLTRAWTGGDWGVMPPRDPTDTEARYDAEMIQDTSLPKDVSHIGSVASWAGNDRMWWWGDPETYGGDCQRFEGGTGMTYPPMMDADSTPYVFIDDMYRKLKLVYVQDGSTKGIPTKRFIIHNDELGFSSNSACYHQQYIGVFNITPVVFAPLLVTGNVYVGFDETQRLKAPSETYPGDQRLALNITIDGRLPQDVRAAEYDNLLTYLDVYNDAGMLMQGAARLQTNTWLKPPQVPGCEDFFPQFKANAYGLFPETLMPIFYESREASISDSVAAYVRDDVLVFFVVLRVVGGVVLGVGLIMGFVAGCLWTRQSRKHIVELRDGEGSGDSIAPTASVVRRVGMVNAGPWSSIDVEPPGQSMSLSLRTEDGARLRKT
jgi:hypothetical protein